MELLAGLETATIPTLTILANIPRSFVRHAKYAITGEHRANAVRLENETGKRLSFREDKSLPEYKIRIETN